MKTCHFAGLLTALGASLATTAAFGQAAYPTAVMATSPTAYYRLNENPVTPPVTEGDPTTPGGPLPVLVDETGNHPGQWGIPGVIVGADVHDFRESIPDTDVPGPSASLGGYAGLEATNEAARMRGNDNASIPDRQHQVFKLPDDGTFHNGTASFAFFTKMPTSGHYNGRFFTTDASAAAAGQKLMVAFSDDPGGTTGDFGDTYNALFVNVVGTNGTPINYGLSPNLVNLANDAWHHIVVTRDNSPDPLVSIYVDGVDYTSQLSVVSNYNWSTPADGEGPFMGSRNAYAPATGWGAVNGEMDEMAYWNRVLTPAEAAGLYSAAIGGGGGQLGDQDGDDDVDGEDFLIIQRGFGDTHDGTDFADWAANFGTPAVAAGGAVPEPMSAGMLALALGSLAGLRKRSR